jgi:GR25 family glycosyltransferase involved in LPS biosynthesis
MSSICLNMIVKNESKVIIKTLENLTSKIKFNYWVISDTGSTDNTKELIINYFKEKNIPGELMENDWKDFGHNRSLALTGAYNKTDYLLIFDADDELHGYIDLNNLTSDMYNLRFGNVFTYERPLLVNNRKKWFFRGILHEFLHSDEIRTKSSLQGDYFIVSGRTGYRSKNINKYYNDAIILNNAFLTETDNFLKCRYAFYCAQSYKDNNNKKEAIEWYNKCLNLNNWDQEKYYSCISIGNLYMELNNFEEAQKYWLRSIIYDNERIEGIIFLIRKLRKNNNHYLINLLYHKYKNYKKPNDKLFLYSDLYNQELEFENSISAYFCNDLYSGYECSKKIIFDNIFDKSKLHFVYENLQFYKECMEKDTQENCIKLLNTVYSNSITNNYNVSANINTYCNNNNNNLSIDNYIKIVSLEHKIDRRNEMIKIMDDNKLTNYEFMNAINGSLLQPNNKLLEFIKNNNFNSRKGIIGCALSHIYLWLQLLNDDKNDYYIIIEDDIQFCYNINEKLNKLKQEFKEKDIIFMGYSMWAKQRNTVRHIYDIEADNIIIDNLNKELYIGGTFMYSINKLGAKKMIDFINSNGLKEPIDNTMQKNTNINYFECKPLLAFTEWAENGKQIDSDIQFNFDSLTTN